MPRFLRVLAPVICASAPLRLSAQTPADSVAWRTAMVAEVAQFIHHDAPRGGVRIVSSDSSETQAWTEAFVAQVVAAVDSLRSPGDPPAPGGTVTFSGPMTFEQPFGGFPRELIQVRMEETTCLFVGGGQGYLSGAIYHIRLFIRGGKLLTDIDSQGQPEGTCSQ